MKEGTPEYINGKKTGLVWSEKYEDFIFPNLDQKKIDAEPQAIKNVKVCYTCEHWLPRTRRCDVCGCFMDVKSIVNRLVSQPYVKSQSITCPLGKW
jgi:hypothetical protein